ncbi:MFS transporter [Candidatus Parcubacteria bacterium]|nr:MFS transporter [Candidatus Parcubacteria bacterium]
MFKYFTGRISQGFFAIYSMRALLRVSTALIGLFLPIFLYELFDFKLQYVIYYYLAGSLLYSLPIAWGARHLNQIGLKRSIRVSVVLGALYYVCFYVLGLANSSNKIEIMALLILSLVFITLHRILHWVPVHTDIAKFTNKLNRARQISLMEVTAHIAHATMPIVAGWILLFYSYDILFFIAIILYLSSLIPLAHLPRTKERFSWAYLETWKEFFSKKRRKVVLAYLSDGAEAVVGLVIWPIFIWKLLHGNYFEVGVISSAIVVVTIFLQLAIGKLIDKKNKKKMLKWGTAMYAVGWVIKIFIASAFQIFVASTFHSLMRVFSRTSFDAITYENAASEGHYVDEYTVIHEMAIYLGKALMLCLILILIKFFSIEWTFLLAAIASLAMNFVSHEK